MDDMDGMDEMDNHGEPRWPPRGAHSAPAAGPSVASIAPPLAGPRRLLRPRRAPRAACESPPVAPAACAPPPAGAGLGQVVQVVPIVHIVHIVHFVHAGLYGFS